MKKLLVIMTIVASAVSFPGCKSKEKDADVKTAVETALTGVPSTGGLMIDVKDGVATISGEVADQAARVNIEEVAKGVKGVESVVNNTTVAPPPPPVAEPVIAADDPLSMAVKDAIKDHPGVTAEVKDGVITLSGTISKADNRILMQKLNGAHPKSIDSKKLTVK